MIDADTCPCVPVSWGELIDKITILEIKRERIDDSAAQANVGRELDALRAVAGMILTDPATGPFIARLRAVNAELWDIEDEIRGKEAAEDFGDRFVDLARSVYRLNDRRAAIKRGINVQLGSALVEEKSYMAPQVADARRAEPRMC
jgi:hypothetical protein